MAGTEQRHGGCQCGSIRYRADTLRKDSHVCHCRMCQKAAGNFFMALVGVPLSDLSWTRGEPAIFMSSEHVKRGFCRDCGTPLFFWHTEKSYIAMTTGSFDHPAQIPMDTQYGIEARLPQIDQLTDPGNLLMTEVDIPDEVAGIRASNRQHPDQETEDWPAVIDTNKADI